MPDIILPKTNDVATLVAGPDPYLATNEFSIKGYLFNVGKRTAWIATHGNAQFLQHAQQIGCVPLIPGLAIPLKVNKFHFYTERGHTTLLWLPGESPPVFSVPLVTGENGLVVHDAAAAQALKSLADKIENLAAAIAVLAPQEK